MQRILLITLAALVCLTCGCNKDDEVTTPVNPGGDDPSGDDTGAIQRLITASSTASCNEVFYFLPAPGQFVNERYDATTMEEACAYAMERFETGQYVSLGAFGGYLVAGFDHSIVNTGGYDFAVIGNSFDGSSEPGIVWVMQDENRNGKPDDTWYELAGSETGKESTIQDYAVTYYRPEEAGQSVRWTDNRGGEGTVDYLAAYHKQDYYYPAWVTENSYTLRGTRLEARNYDQSGNGTNWIQPAYDWGYADNFSAKDRLKNDKANYFKISDAVDADLKPVDLPFIDFVKVQTALCTKSGWLGENSTEVCGMFDCNMPDSN